MKRFLSLCIVVPLLTVGTTGICHANIKGQHTFYWYDNGAGGAMVGYNAPIPGLQGTELVIIDEWFVDAPQTTTWYGGANVGGLPPTPYAGAPVVVAGQEMYLYQLQNIIYGSGNGGAAPFSFTFPVPPGPGLNGVSGINIIEHPTASGIPISNQFISDPGNGLDTTPGLPLWQFQAFSGYKYEWDIRPAPVGGNGIMAQQAGLFGYTVPAGMTYDVLLDGWIHSWGIPAAGGPAAQVNIANAINGFSGPALIPAPGAFLLVGIGTGIVTALRRRRAL